jgi:predicted MFS family arabinose efflux permease
MLVYILHENVILRSYYRPFLLNWAYQTFGYSQVVLLMLALAVAIFVGTLIVAIIYDKTIRRFVKKLSEAVHTLCSCIWNKFSSWATKSTTEK